MTEATENLIAENARLTMRLSNAIERVTLLKSIRESTERQYEYLHSVFDAASAETDRLGEELSDSREEIARLTEERDDLRAQLDRIASLRNEQAPAEYHIGEKVWEVPAEQNPPAVYFELQDRIAAVTAERDILSAQFDTMLHDRGALVGLLARMAHHFRVPVCICSGRDADSLLVQIDLSNGAVGIEAPRTSSAAFAGLPFGVGDGVDWDIDDEDEAIDLMTQAYPLRTS